MQKDVFLAGAVRTPIGSFCGALSGVSAVSLGSAVIKAALQRAAVEPDQVDEVILGNVLSAGLGQNVARQAAIGAGLPQTIGATTVNKVCGSGLKAVMLAAQAIQCDDARTVVAGGTENMSQAPYLLPKARGGYRLGHGELIDSAIKDGLWDAYDHIHMGACGDHCAARYGLSRRDQDDYAVTSYQRALAATREGVFAREIVPIEAPSGKTVVRVNEDEELQRFNEEQLRALKPAFGPEGTVTAGNASSLNDGAAAVLVLSAERRRQWGAAPTAKILGYASAAGEPRWFTLAPIHAIRALLTKADLSIQDVDLFEINEAFSAVPLAAMKELGISHEKVNIHGGAAALGHPIGASGARTLATLLNAMKHRQARIGVTALCIGGGEAVAMAVELV